MGVETNTEFFAYIYLYIYISIFILKRAARQTDHSIVGKSQSRCGILHEIQSYELFMLFR